MIEGNKKVQKNTFNNDWYKPGAPKIKLVLWYFVNAIFFINPLNPINGLKVFLLRLFGTSIGKRCIIKPGVNIKYPWNLSIGDYVSVGEKVWIDNLDKVVLGDHTTLSQGAMILTGNHNYRSVSFDLVTKPVLLEEGVWIGAKAIVCPGVVCYSHSILTVGSVINRSMDAYTIYAGNPAEPVRQRIIS